MSKSENPIIAAVRRSLQGKQLVPVSQNWRSEPQVLLRESVRVTFGEDAIREVGTLVCLALLTGDRRIVKAVKDAIKESDHLFNRDRESELCGHVMTYLPELWRRSWSDVAAIKKEIEKRSNHGKPLRQHQWNRLRRAVHLPKLHTGRPRNSDTKRHKTVY
jgi:hypothetical protein